MPVQVEGAHTLGVMGVSWAPAVPRGSLTSVKAPGPPERRFATGGCDNTVKVWFLSPALPAAHKWRRAAARSQACLRTGPLLCLGPPLI